MTPDLLALVFVAFLAAGGIKGLMGVGLPTTSIAIMGAGLELRVAIPILVGPALIANLWQILQAGRPGAFVRRFWLMGASACLGIWVGTDAAPSQGTLRARRAWWVTGRDVEAFPGPLRFRDTGSSG